MLHENPGNPKVWFNLGTSLVQYGDHLTRKGPPFARKVLQESRAAFTEAVECLHYSQRADKRLETAAAQDLLQHARDRVRLLRDMVPSDQEHPDQEDNAQQESPSSDACVPLSDASSGCSGGDEVRGKPNKKKRKRQRNSFRKYDPDHAASLSLAVLFIFCMHASENVSLFLKS